jgi:DNA modification methylase
MTLNSHVFLQGDSLEILKELPDETAQCCVTSPPYYGLRDYGVQGQIGVEASPDEYVSRLVDVFREVKRVLRNDGTCFLNLGDTYAANRSYQVADSKHKNVGNNTGMKVPHGLKAKDLIGIPWMTAFVLRSDGWYLRSAIVWHKNSVMPESVRDRPTNCYENVFLLTKNDKYYWDDFAVAEEATMKPQNRYTERAKHPKGDVGIPLHRRAPGGTGSATRNCRNVWSINPQPFREAHFATMPPALAERCIMAGTSEKGCCVYCRKPWKRIVVKGEPDLDHMQACGGDTSGNYIGQSQKDYASAKAQDASETKRRILAGMVSKTTAGWKQDCGCPSHEPIPCLVIDPFSGAGTTSVAAETLGRDSAGIDLNPDYVQIAKNRVGGNQLDAFVWGFL